MFTCDDERIALYINGDLVESERTDLEAHLTECARCRNLEEALRCDSEAVQGAVEAAHVPAMALRAWGTRRRVFRPAVAAAVLVALLVALLVGITAGPAIAETVVKIWRGLTIKEVSVTEFQAEMQKLVAEATEAPRVLISYDVAEVEKVVGFKLMTPSRLPEGFVPQRMEVFQGVFKGRTFYDVDQTLACYTCTPVQRLRVSQFELVTPPAGSVKRDVVRPEGTTTVVEVAGIEGLLSHWDSIGASVYSTTLTFVKGNRAVTLLASNMTDEALIAIAESLR